MENPKKPKKVSAEKIAKINKLVWPIDTDEWIEWGVEDISNEDIKELSNLLFWDESEQEEK